MNVTPDSFSDGGQYADPAAAIAHGLQLVADGAAIVDVGGESTRPQGARGVSAAEELERVLPVIRGLVRGGATVSIDTTKAEVARAAVDAGAAIINDISGGHFDPGMIDLAAASGAFYVCGHVRGGTLAEVHAGDLGFEEVAYDLAARVAELPIALRQRTIVDPGIGFGKRGAANLELLARCGEIAAGCGRPVLVGPSRKRFLGELTGRPVDDRDAATVGACLAAVAAGAHMVRVHDVRALAPALAAFTAVRGIA
ncbi:MAG TPA: dihydropteroate synthase [Kofleriaceae bacterium]|nr:dihydropteroate synthase [Kofleriaceae bacterium]